MLQFVSYLFKEYTEEQFLASKFSELFNLKKVTLKNEIITLQYDDIFLRARSSEEDFWNLILKEKCPNLGKWCHQLDLLWIHVSVQIAFFYFKTNEI